MTTETDPGSTGQHDAQPLSTEPIDPEPVDLGQNDIEPVDVGATDERGSDTPAAPLNRLAVASLVAAVVALVGTVTLGLATLSVLGVGLGHVALHQVRPRGERGAVLASASLVVCYLIAVSALLTQTYYAVTLTTG